MLPKLVIDTNTFVSAFFWKGNETELLKKIEKGRARLYLTEEILNEIEDVLERPKFREIARTASLTSTEIIQKIVSLSHLVVGPRLNITACRDKKDNKFLECAVHAKAHYLVSGDKDLLCLKKYEDVFIVRTSKMLELLESFHN